MLQKIWTQNEKTTMEFPVRYEEKFIPIAGLDETCISKINEDIKKQSESNGSNEYVLKYDNALKNRAEVLLKYLKDCIIEENPVVIITKDRDKATLSDKTVKVLKKIGKDSENYRLVINRTTSTPEKQANVMYENILSTSVSDQLDLYGDNGDKVIEVYKKNITKTKDEIISLMLSKINDVGPSLVSNHCGSFTDFNVMDISLNCIENKQKFIKEIDKLKLNGTVKAFWYPDIKSGEKAYHLEINQ